MINWGSTIRGIRAMKRPYPDPKPRWGIWKALGFWCEVWTPDWHKGRGPYISIGLGLFAVGRGY